MAHITYQGTPVTTIGNLPLINTPAPNFTFVGTNLKDVTLDSFMGSNIILNIFPSLDTPTCATTVQKFNTFAGLKPKTKIICISYDLPFAHKRFCSTEGIVNTIPASCFRNPEFGELYGVKILDSPFKGLLSRAVVVINAFGHVIYTEQVSELIEAPNYDAILASF